MAQNQAVIDAKHKEREQAGLFYQMALEFLTAPSEALDPAEIAPILSVSEVDSWHGESNRKGQALVEFSLNIVEGFPITFNLWTRNSLRQPAEFCGKMLNGNRFWFVRGYNGDVWRYQLLGDAILQAENLAAEQARRCEEDAEL